MKRFLLIAIHILIVFIGMLSFSDAQNLDFSIIPEAQNDPGTDVQFVAQEPGKVRENYDDIAHDRDGVNRTLGDKLASGIMNRDTLLDYVVYLVRFMSQLGILIGACMFVYAGYMYATDIFAGNASKGPSAIKYAIIGIVVLSFSYAILKILTNMFIK